MIRPTVVVFVPCVVSSAQSMSCAPLQQRDSSVIPGRQGCGLGHQLVDGICVSTDAVAAISGLRCWSGSPPASWTTADL